MPAIGITMGDPCGVGPEIICKALAALTPAERATFVVVGQAPILARAAELVRAPLRFAPFDRSGDSPSRTPAEVVRVVDVQAPAAETIADGKVTAGGGHAAYASVVEAVKLARAGILGVIVTAPLNKAAMHLAGHHFDGHTGLLQHLTEAPSSFMLLASEKLSTIHVSTHVSLEEAIARTRTPRVLETIMAGHAHMQRMGIAEPRIAVAGLNPHCGEGGIFGKQDEEQIAPAIEAAAARGVRASGPWPADTIFYRAAQGAFDLVVAQYHDQGHIPTKLIAFDTTVNVSLGLPIDRTSVDHGTAFDIAWKGQAKHDNMLAAIAYAERLRAGCARAGAA